MQFNDFIASLEQQTCPDGVEPCLQALWHAARGDWDTAHEIVQALDSRMAARIHAYLHRQEGDDWNARYWHRHAGTQFPADMTLAEEWEGLVRALLEPNPGASVP